MQASQLWADEDLAILIRLAIEGWPAHEIARRLGKPVTEVRRRARRVGLSLRPPPHSPFLRGTATAALDELQRHYLATAGHTHH
jgi:hypothetical protein